MKIITLLTLLLLVSCSGKDEQFCQCLSAGEQLNAYTQQFLDKTPSAEETNTVNELKKAKTEACKTYQMMRGDIMRQKKAACEE
ncbi:MAG: hypothetical protein P8N52_03780 [Crocinitomicaceae bacterium]|nr:hypothetical protein [Crocinitomicaceae bacterium]MDG1777139.1 hypothetical protein [Crocinitomicaceae bacterium]